MIYRELAIIIWQKKVRRREEFVQQVKKSTDLKAKNTL